MGDSIRSFDRIGLTVGLLIFFAASGAIGFIWAIERRRRWLAALAVIYVAAGSALAYWWPHLR